MSGVVIEEFRPIIRNTLRGFARVRMPSGVIFHDVSVHQKGEILWASPPSKPAMGRDGSQIKRDGKLTWAPIITFATKEVRDSFSSAVVNALRAARPEVFDAPGK